MQDTIPPEMRQDGFYWVRPLDRQEWLVLRSSSSGLWEEGCDYKDIAEIGPRITRESAEDTARLDWVIAKCVMAPLDRDEIDAARGRLSTLQERQLVYCDYCDDCKGHDKFHGTK